MMRLRFATLLEAKQRSINWVGFFFKREINKLLLINPLLLSPPPPGFATANLIIGLLYYTLGNLDPVFRSSLKSIHLLGVAKYEHIRVYGIEEFIKPVIEDLKSLESVSMISGDFLNQHQYVLCRTLELNSTLMVMLYIFEGQSLFSLLTI